MKHRLLLLFVIAVLPLCGRAQNDNNTSVADTSEEITSFLVPDYDYLQRVTSDPSSRFYYPSLLKRFADADTTLDIEDIHCLYFGSVVQKGYNPYINLKEENKARELLDKEPVSKRDAKRAIRLLDKAIARCPIHLPLYMYRHYANSVLYGEDSRQCQADAFHYVALISGISASGDGSDYGSALHVAVVVHAYSLISYYGLVERSQSLQFDSLGNSYDVYQLGENEYGIERLCFNITPCFGFLSRLFDSQDDDEEGEFASEPIDIAIGTYAIVSVESDKENNTCRYRISERGKCSRDVSLTEVDNILPADGKENTVHFYFVNGTGGKALLLIKSFCKERLTYDSYIRILDSQNWQTTSNSGIFPRVNMTELWNDPVRVIRISNLNLAK